MRSQTVRFDELVIFDDCSTDGTADLISKFRDNRIRVCIGGTNRGHVAAFEAALRKTTADIVLLADQDDVWEPTKIEVIKGVFESDERIVTENRIECVISCGKSNSPSSLVAEWPSGGR